MHCRSLGSFATTRLWPTMVVLLSSLAGCRAPLSPGAPPPAPSAESSPSDAGSGVPRDPLDDDEPANTRANGECPIRFPSSGVAELPFDAAQTAITSLDRLKIVCHDLGSLPVDTLVVVAPSRVFVPASLGAIGIVRASSLKEARALAAKDASVSDLVALEVSKDELICAYERLRAPPKLGGLTMVFWRLSRSNTSSICMKVRLETTAAIPNRPTMGLAAVVRASSVSRRAGTGKHRWLRR